MLKHEIRLTYPMITEIQIKVQSEEYFSVGTHMKWVKDVRIFERFIQILIFA